MFSKTICMNNYSFEKFVHGTILLKVYSFDKISDEKYLNFNKNFCFHEYLFK